jgi:branched-chain amino acid transport system substrate-binding protein
MKKLAFGAVAFAVTLAFGQPARADDLVLGLAGPFSGPNAAFGEQFKHGAEMAVSDLNAKGGILGRKIKLVTGDDASDPKQGVSVANDMVAKRVWAVIGNFNSGVSIPASDVFHEERILQISPASTAPALTERGYDTVFRTCGRDDKQGAVAGSYLAIKYKGKNIAILNDKTAYGKGLAEETRKALNKAGVTEKLFESITPGEKDYSSIVSKLKSLQIDAMYLGGYHPEAGLILRQAREQGLAATLIGGDALAASEFWSITGNAGQGSLFTFEPDWRTSPAAKPLVDKFKATGYEPEGYTLNTYAAVQVLAQAAEKAKSTKLDDMLKAMHGGSFATVLGTLSFDDKGDLKDPKYVFYKWADGKYAESGAP